MNKAFLVGRLTRDPELRNVSGGIAVARFTVAIDRMRSANGDKQTDFINCVVWRAQAENVARYLHKGSLVGVDGSIQTRSYDDASGQKRYVTEVVANRVSFLESRAQSEAHAQASADGSGARDNSFGSYDFNQDRRQPARAAQPAPSPVEPKPADAGKKAEDPFKEFSSDFDISNDDLPF